MNRAGRSASETIPAPAGGPRSRQRPPGPPGWHGCIATPSVPSNRTASTASNPPAVPGWRSRAIVAMSPTSGTRDRPVRAEFRCSRAGRPENRNSVPSRAAGPALCQARASHVVTRPAEPQPTRRSPGERHERTYSTKVSVVARKSKHAFALKGRRSARLI